jgi:hypothetical protein
MCWVPVKLKRRIAVASAWYDVNVGLTIHPSPVSTGRVGSDGAAAQDLRGRDGPAPRPAATHRLRW